MSKGTIICLCDITGVMAEPWVEAGYRAVLVDPQHPDTSINGPIERISATIIEAMPRLSQIIRTENVIMVIGFPPCTAFRVLWPHGVLIFKWNETQIPVSNILALTDEKPVIWQRTGKADKTHWVIFVKGGPHVQDNPA